MMPRIGVIGAGNWGKNHVKTFHALGALAAVAEADPQRREAIKEGFPQAVVYDDYRALLNDERIDGVVVASPAFTHHEISRAALLAGKDVLVEKPMAMNLAEADELIALAKSGGRILMVGHLLLYSPAVRAIIDTVKNGDIGEIVHLELRRLKLGRVRREENVFWSFAPHDLAVVLQLVEGAPVAVKASGICALQSNIEDDVHAHLTFENGVRAHLHASWFWPEVERRTVIVGTEGMIFYDELKNEARLYSKGIDHDLEIWDKGVREIPFQKSAALLELEDRHFLDCIEQRAVPLTDGENGRKVIDILMRVDAELRAGKGAKGDSPGKTETEAEKDYFVHETAVVEEPAAIGKGTKIWHFCHVMPGAKIGERCMLGQNVLVGGKARIGNNVRIQNNVSVYDGVFLEDDVFCGPSMVFTNVKVPRSAYPLAGSDEFAVTRIKRGATIGANATIVCGTTIGEHALVGAGAVVTSDVPAHAVVYGNPARVRAWICKCGKTVAAFDDQSAGCEHCQTFK